MVQTGQLIGPFLCVFLLLKFLENGDLCVRVRALRPAKLVLEHISEIVMRRRLHKFLIVILRVVIIAHPDRDFRQTVDNHTSDRRAVIRHQIQLTALLITPCLLVDLSRLHQCIDIFYFMPVDGIRNLRRVLVIAGGRERLHLLQL